MMVTLAFIGHEENSYDLGHNILEVYNFLVQIGLTTSKTKRDV